MRLPAGDDGWGVCRAAPARATACTGSPLDQCCDDGACGAGACVEGPLFHCGGARPQVANLCLEDACASDADCRGAKDLCIPAGVFGEPVAVCVAGDCRLDADCTASAGGECNPFFDPCNRRLVGFFCAYATSECRGDLDCAHVSNGYCAAPSGARTEPRCLEFIPPP